MLPSALLYPPAALHTISVTPMPATDVLLVYTVLSLLLRNRSSEVGEKERLDDESYVRQAANRPLWVKCRNIGEQMFEDRSTYMGVKKHVPRHRDVMLSVPAMLNGFPNGY
ncbi:hypothetical protein NUW54_g8767 [Trametes sanguinea]|uniref:Uncharacterized protein n=1 Tax=Trametes sanguinea TaxID=158606 RepID=A0ACC1PAX8_9APHY|nr:hypothetical protein NUW54_g8767 [Trametes sanguinea]